MSLRAKKQEGLILAPSGTLETIRHHVEANGKRMVITIFNKEGSSQLYIGSSNIYCIDALLRKDAMGTYLETGELNKIRWDGSCSTPTFQRGRDTAMILRLLLTYIKDHYPTVQRLQFTDMSTRDCGNGSSINLAGMKLFTTGLTWYETEFHATISREHRERYEAMKRYANEQKTRLTWEESARYIRWNRLPFPEQEVKAQYEQSATWQPLFSWIQHRFQSEQGAAAFCMWLSEAGWFDSFLSFLRFRSIDLTFEFLVADFSQLYTLQHGGRRFTHRIRKDKSIRCTSNCRMVIIT